MGLPVVLDDLERFFHTLPFGILLFDEEQRVVYANNRIAEIIRIPVETLFNTHFFEMIMSDEKGLKNANIKMHSAYEHDFDDLELKITGKDNEKIIIHCSAVSIELDNQPHIILSVQDITKRKAFEKVMESSFDNFIQTTIDLDNALKKINEQRTVLEQYKKHIDRELSVARGVQQSLIPTVCPEYNSLNIDATTISSAELGGDYFDFYKLPGNKLGIFIADVSGHGVASSLVSSMVKAYMADITDRFNRPREILGQLNKKVLEAIAGTDFFLTAFFSIIDTDTLEVVSANAGHLSALCYRNKTGRIIPVGEKISGTVLGSFRNNRFTEERLKLSEGDILLFYTDGIVEARNNKKEFYSIRRLELFMKSHAGSTPQELVKRLMADINKFSSTEKKGDDMTCIVVKVTKPALIQSKKSRIDSAYVAGRKYIKEKKYNRALDEYMAILDIDPKQVGAYSAIGRILSIIGNPANAEKYLKKAIEIDPNYHQGYYYLGIVLYNQKKYDEAKKYWLSLKKSAGNYKKTDDFIKKVDHSIKPEI